MQSNTVICVRLLFAYNFDNNGSKKENEFSVICYWVNHTCEKTVETKFTAFGMFTL